jgi:hypothetical protein
MVLSVYTFLEISLDYEVIKCDILFHFEFNMEIEFPNPLKLILFQLDGEF